MKNADMPAMPTIYADMAANGQREIYCDQVGLTKREMFAMNAMKGILANSALKMDISHIEVARFAIAYADELLTELEK